MISRREASTYRELIRTLLRRENLKRGSKLRRSPPTRTHSAPPHTHRQPTSTNERKKEANPHTLPSHSRAHTQKVINTTEQYTRRTQTTGQLELGEHYHAPRRKRERLKTSAWPEGRGAVLARVRGGQRRISCPLSSERRGPPQIRLGGPPPLALQKNGSPKAPPKTTQNDF